MSQVAIARELGISQGAVSRALAFAERAALDILGGERRTKIVRALGRLEHVYARSIASFEESRTPAPRKRSSHTSGGPSDGTRTATIDLQDSSPGDARHLRNALQAVAGIRQLLALDAPTPTLDAENTRPHMDEPEEQLRAEIATLLEQAGLSPSRLTH